MTTTRIQLDPSGESQVFTATRPVRNSDHDLGTIEPGARVFFRRDAEADAIALLYEADGSPTNGNQYSTFPTLAEAEAFTRRAGLEPVSE